MFEVKTKCIIHNFAFFFLETFDCVNTHDRKWYGQVTYEKKKKKEKVLHAQGRFFKKVLKLCQDKFPFPSSMLKRCTCVLTHLFLIQGYNARKSY